MKRKPSATAKAIAAGKARLYLVNRPKPDALVAHDRRQAARTLTAFKLGSLRRLEYRHSDGKRYLHTFKAPVGLGVSACGRFIVIGPTNVKPYIAR